MKKAIFKYRKDDGSEKERIILRPQMLKEASNYLKDINNPSVNFIHGYELDRSGLLGADIARYEQLIEEYFAIEFPTLETFLANNGMDPKKVQQKTFKKNNISELDIM